MLNSIQQLEEIYEIINDFILSLTMPGAKKEESQ
jgi:hypothetical protein